MIRRLKNYYHFIRSLSAAYLFRHPAKTMTVIGVTGTDGKTTTAHLLFHILQTAGKQVGIISTIGAEIGTKKHDTGFHVTTPDAFAVQSFLDHAKRENITHFILEVTSHALDQYRVKHVPFTIGVLTNITHEHLDYHRTLDQYLTTKVMLLANSKIAVINKDDSSYPLVSKKLAGGQFRGKIITYGQKNADVTIPKVPYKTSLQGAYNTYNILAAVAAAKEVGIQDTQIRKAIASFTLPTGRFEIVYKKNFTVIIDFAHTPNALQQLLVAIRKDVLKKGRVIHVFGAAGERDKSKRPAMGRVSQKLADTIVLTGEDSRGEKTEKIIADIKSGIEGSEKHVIGIPDRKMAIATALNLAKKGDVVVITGKGHERSMNMRSGEEPWNDQQVALSLLKT